MIETLSIHGSWVLSRGNSEKYGRIDLPFMDPSLSASSVVYFTPDRFFHHRRHVICMTPRESGDDRGSWSQ